jgi:hypothetical protein
MRRRSGLWLAIAASLFLAGAGCGGQKDYQVSGTVTFDGKPVPTGYVTFEPDTEKGNTGPGGGAEIRNGKFTTSRGKGVVGGAYRVKIVGYDGKPTSANGEELADGKSLFPIYQTLVEFPKESITKDFEVPLKPPPPVLKPGQSGDGL